MAPGQFGHLWQQFLIRTSGADPVTPPILSKKKGEFDKGFDKGPDKGSDKVFRALGRV
jgi:hypothetical protein